MNSLNFDWYQALPFTLPESLAQQIIDFSDSPEKSPHWFSFSKSYSIEQPSELVNRGRRLIFLEHAPDLLQSAANETMDQFFNDACLSKSDIIPNFTAIPSMISVLYDAESHSVGVHPHTDPACKTTGWPQLRMNFMVRNATAGGNPIVEDQILDVPDLGGWYLFATDQQHRALPVKGDCSRIILSMAYFVNPAYKPELKRLLAAAF